MLDVSEPQRQLLQAVLTGTPLPGTSRALRLPDLRFVQTQPATRIAAEHLADPEGLGGISPDLRCVPEPQLASAAPGPASAYLAFGAPQVSHNSVVLTLQIRLPAGANQHPLGLSGVVATFDRVGEDWRAREDWALLAT